MPELPGRASTGLPVALPPPPVAGTALVTGGTGFVGDALVRTLVSVGVDVRVLDVRAPAEPVAGVEYREGSVLDPDALDTALDGARYVFHLAANASLWADDPAAFVELNTGGTRALIAAAGGRPLERIVVTSSETTMKPRRGRPEGIHEGLELAPDDLTGAYPASKRLAELAALDAARAGLPVVVVNPTLPIGARDAQLTPPTRMLIDYLSGRDPAYLEFSLNLVDVRDAAAGHWLAAVRGHPGRRYLLGGENLTMSALLAMLTELTGLSMPRARIPHALAYTVAAVSELVADRVTHRAPRASLTGVRLARCDAPTDDRLARRELGYASRPAIEALADACRWLAAEGHLKRPFARDPAAVLAARAR